MKGSVDSWFSAFPIKRDILKLHSQLPAIFSSPSSKKGAHQIVGDDSSYVIFMIVCLSVHITTKHHCPQFRAGANSGAVLDMVGCTHSEGEAVGSQSQVATEGPRQCEQKFLVKKGFVICGTFSSADGSYKFSLFSEHCPLVAGRHHQSHADAIRK